jgi:hypothetical protein
MKGLLMQVSYCAYIMLSFIIKRPETNISTHEYPYINVNGFLKVMG